MVTTFFFLHRKKGFLYLYFGSIRLTLGGLVDLIASKTQSSCCETISIRKASDYLGLSLRGEACPQGVQRLADHRGGTRGQTAAHKVNSSRLTVVCRGVVHGLSKQLEADKLRVEDTVTTHLCCYLGVDGQV